MTSRPRDQFGRPLGHDSDAVIEPDPSAAPPEETLQTAAALLREGRAFRAHEVFEAIWKQTQGEERELWRGLAQVAVGLTHAQRGNVRGSATLLRRAAENLLPWQEQQPYGVPVAELRAWALEGALQPLPAERLLAAMPPLTGGADRSGG
jgi:hypothetical protein